MPAGVNTVAMAGITPVGVVNVCSGSEMLQLTCNTSGVLQRWISSTLIPNGHLLQSFGSGEPHILPLVNSTITISRISGPNILPLVSRLVISPVSDALNGTEVGCVDLDALNSSSSAIINVVQPTEGETMGRLHFVTAIKRI